MNDTWMTGTKAAIEAHLVTEYGFTAEDARVALTGIAARQTRQAGPVLIHRDAGRRYGVQPASRRSGAQPRTISCTITPRAWLTAAHAGQV